MLTATRALKRRGQVGVLLPQIENLRELHTGYFKYRPRGGNVTMIAGPPGALKSGLAVYMAAHWASMGLEGLYLSADLDQHTAITRTAGALSGNLVDTIAKSISDENGAAFAYYEQVLDIPLRFSFNPSPAMADVRAELDAWVEMWDSYPKFIVIDNLLDVIPSGGDSETSGYKSILLEVKDLARKTGAHVIILHHMSESDQGDGRKGNVTRPASRKAVMGKVSQTPENVMSVAFDDNTGMLLISLVKHRGGKADATAENYISLRVDPARNTISPRTQNVVTYEHE